MGKKGENERRLKSLHLQEPFSTRKKKKRRRRRQRKRKKKKGRITLS